MMKDSTDNTAHSLGEWLAIATRGLVTPSRERIQLEIEAHYADAVKSRMDEGLTQADAEAAALHELGDPKAAAKDFRKRHLTEDDEKWLHTWLKNSRNFVNSRTFWPGLCINLLLGGGWWWGWNHFQKIPQNLDWSLGIGLGFYFAYVVTCLRFRSLLKRSALSYGIIGEIYTLDILHNSALAAFFFSVASSAFWLGVPGFLVAFGRVIYKRLPLWRKLRSSKSADGNGFETGSA